MELIQQTSHISNVLPAPSAAQEYPIEFTASGSEYFRIWIVNLLLILVTFGIYLPWAKVRKLRYFYSNTHIDGHALDFHGQGGQMLRGLAIVWVFLLAYSMATEISGWAGLVAALVFVSLWPMLFRASMRFRLANTSWRGLRFHFTGDEKGAYQAIMPPLALALLPFSLIAALAGAETKGSPVAPPPFAGLAFGGVMLLFVVALPYFLWRIRSYQHNNYAFGQLRSEFRCGASAFYAIVFKTIGVTLLGVVIVGLAGYFMRPAGGVGAGAIMLIAALFVAGVLFFNIVPKAYAQSQLQNLVWSRTGSRFFRFKSELAFGPYAALQFKNFLLIFLTLGLYWPFAVVATRRAQLHAVTLKSRIGLDDLTGAAHAGKPDAAGDAAADVFGLDLGM